MDFSTWSAATRRSHLSEALRQLNARHPWSHNDHFHPWILQQLPDRRERALDVGCGRGELLARLAENFHHVVGVDTDPAMRTAAGRRCAGLPSVEVVDTPFAELGGRFDLITMVAVLHHLDLDQAFTTVRRQLAPGGRFLVVGLAPVHSPSDVVWDTAGALTNPLIGLVKHPWPARAEPEPDPFPTAEPKVPFAEISRTARLLLPGAVLQRRLGFRYTLRWTKPVDD